MKPEKGNNHRVRVIDVVNCKSFPDPFLYQGLKALKYTDVFDD